METCDALIIGGGPAGSSCARQLRRHGLDVMVMDQAEFPRDKVCAGWITPAVLRTLEIDPRAHARQHTLQPIRAFRTGLIDDRPLTSRYPDTISYGIRRSEFDDYLLKRTDARLALGQPMESLRREGSRWVINDAVRTPLLIGAGGHFCPVARHLGARVGGGDTAVVAKEVEFEMDAGQIAACEVKPEMPELYFCEDLSGYGWCIRKGRFLNIGLGMERAQGLNRALARLCRFLEQSGRIPPDIPDRFRGHAYLLYGRSDRKLLDDGVLLLGDAAGVACPRSGEGILPAVESGLMAAATVLQAVGDYRGDRLATYRERLSARYGVPPGGAANRAAGTLRKGLGRLLLRSRWLTRHVVLDRWFLHAGQADLQGT
ncbi:FAD-dependent oxidoreductase [Accumulibacter sp.]|uniref:NAD(P)/FAD-dependent oxidoreductase n=1 Tax=Accumulibacter sp. TaxID=2053492 RepID=UPI002639A7F8|nr:FAD-dependent oxidoreductase [Accumulibacter sp.]